MTRSEAKPRPTRKTLRDISNDHNITSNRYRQNAGGAGEKLSKSAKTTMKKKEEEIEKKNQHLTGDDGKDCLDRLLLLHSDLSSLSLQIDELVAQAFKPKAISNHGRREIESFSFVLADALSSLKPWLPRLKQALSTPSKEPEIQLDNSLADPAVSAKIEDENFEVESPKQMKMESLISPSPLVSWRAGCNVERGRQMFLVTPLPMSKTTTYKCEGLYNSVSERFNSNLAAEPSSFTITGAEGDSFLQCVAGKPTTSKPPDSLITELRNKLECAFITSPTPKGDRSMLFMTPCLKMSPPKSCVLLEPMPKTAQKGNTRLRKSTPFPIRTHAQDPENSSSEDSEDLGLKYPELLGIQQAYKSRLRTKELESTPKWAFSPFKTCVLLEPQAGNLDVNANDHQLPIECPIPKQQAKLASSKQCNIQDNHQQFENSYNQATGTSKLVERTPMLKEPESTMKTGKRPGENTLKKELWTKFEAASSYGGRLNLATYQETARNGFLDMLDEVSCDGEI